MTDDEILALEKRCMTGGSKMDVLQLVSLGRETREELERLRGRWIKCAEQDPPVPGWYLVKRTGAVMARHDGANVWHGPGGDVTHWHTRPIPEPPEPGE
jgi:hypothetical protein